MTEEEWLAERNPSVLVNYYQSKSKLHRTKVGRRKLRLFGCACCRRVLPLGCSVNCIKLVDLAEQLAEGEVSSKDIDPLLALVPQQGENGVAPCLMAAARYVASPDVMDAAFRTSIVTHNAFAYSQRPASSSEHVELAFQERAEQERLFRCIFSNPFRPVALDPSWLTSTVVQLAQGIHADRAFDRLPILADALQDAGCDNPDVLNHCHDTGPHARGCWVVDMLLGKS